MHTLTALLVALVASAVTVSAAPLPKADANPQWNTLYAPLSVVGGTIALEAERKRQASKPQLEALGPVDTRQRSGSRVVTYEAGSCPTDRIQDLCFRKYRHQFNKCFKAKLYNAGCRNQAILSQPEQWRQLAEKEEARRKKKEAE